MTVTKVFGVQGFPLRAMGHGWPAVDSRGGTRAPGGDCCGGRCNGQPGSDGTHGNPLFCALRRKELPGNNRFEGLYIMRNLHSRQKRSATATNAKHIKRILGERFRVARHACWLTIPQAAKILHVTERTVRNWEAGTARPPYSAYKLMRILRGCDLPNGCGLLSNAWAGWSFQRDLLVSPEGRTFKGTDSAWWSLLVQRAKLSSTLNAKLKQAEQQNAHRLANAAARHTVKTPADHSASDVPSANRGLKGGGWYQIDTKLGFWTGIGSAQIPANPTAQRVSP